MGRGKSARKIELIDVMYMKGPVRRMNGSTRRTLRALGYGTVAAAAAAMSFDAERLLWVHRERTIVVLPPRRHWKTSRSALSAPAVPCRRNGCASRSRTGCGAGNGCPLKP
jgi:hypothetical protein